MEFKYAEDVEAFKKCINEECSGNIWLTSCFGDKYNLKSALTQYIALAELIVDRHGQLELWAEKKDDEAVLLKFFNEHPRVTGMIEADIFKTSHED